MKKIFLYVLCLVPCLWGCFEDDGNYSYKELNEITEDGMQWTYAIVEGDSLHIEPKLHFSKDSVNVRLKHEWILPDTTIEGEILDIESYSGPIGYKTCYYKVTDLDIDLPYIFEFMLDVSAKYKAGWLLLTEKDGKPELAMVREMYETNEEGILLNTTYMEEFGIYKNANDVELEGTPVKLVEHFSTTAYASLTPEVWVLLNGGRGTVLLNGQSLQRETFLSEEFIGDQLPEGFRIKDAVFYSHMHYVLSEDGKMYSRKTEEEDAFHAGRFDPEPVGGDRYYVPLIIPTCFYEFDGGLFYERNSNQYLCISDYKWGTDDNGEILEITYNGYPENFTPLNDLGNKRVVYSNFRDGSYWAPTYIYSILYDEVEHKFYRQYFEFVYEYYSRYFEVGPEIYESEFVGNELSEESVMCLSRMTPFFFFSSGANQDKLYWVSTNATAEAPRLYYDFQGDRITTISVAVDEEVGERMGVGTESGKFYIFDVNSKILASGQSKILYEMKGNQGKVVDVIYKVGDNREFDMGAEGR